MWMLLCVSYMFLPGRVPIVIAAAGFKASFYILFLMGAVSRGNIDDI